MKRIFLIFVLALLVFSACSKKETNSNTNPQGENTQNEAKTETTTKETTNEKTETNQKGLVDFFSKIPRMPEYKVVYSVNDNLGGAGTKQTIVLKGTNFKFEAKETAVYGIDGKTYMCISEENVICYEIEQTNNNVKSDLDFRENWQKYNVIELPPKTIAGVRTRCFGYEISGAKHETCYSNEFVPLYSKTETKGTLLEMTAIEYSNKVSDSEFILPAPPQKFEMPNLE